MKAAKKQQTISRSDQLNVWKQQINELDWNDADVMISFSSTLSNVDRKALHLYAMELGLKSKSVGKGSNRYLTVSKKKQKKAKSQEFGAPIALSNQSIDVITNLLQSSPLTDEQRNLNILIQNENSTKEHVRLPFVATLSSDKTNAKITFGVPPEPRANALKAMRENLPIFPHRQEILEVIKQNPVTVISGETGSGKTTQVPQYILEEFAREKKKCRIICTQPRRLAATSIAERVSQERNEALGRTVGYQIRLDSRVSPQSNLIFTTSGYLLRCLMGSKHGEVLQSITHLLLDEVHERDKITDFLLIAVKDGLAINPNLRIILMSATVDSEIFSEYFNKCPILSIPGRLFSTEIFYLSELLKLTKYETKDMTTYMQANKGPKVLRQQAANRDDDSCESPLNVQNNAAKPSVQAEGDVDFYDECLDECIEAESDVVFDQIFCLITDENMSVNHLHATKSRSAVMIAAEKGYLHVITTLLSLGASPTLKDANGCTALDYAIQNDRSDCIQLLEQYRPPEKLDDNDNAYEKAMDQFVLAAYQLTTKKPDEIDHSLLLAVILSIHSTKPSDGSILVFLPGYDDIMTQKDLIETQLVPNNYQLFTLHSEMNNGNNNDQKQVFQRLPHGQRKIILSTNIAETSLTIDDVMYVIDSGKVKQKSYDSISDTTCLTSTWVSQACAKQRAGRAGRVRNGECFRMYSLEHYETMEKYTLPEILRVPLTDVCLNAKILAKEISIEDFLLKALQPPPVQSIRQSIALLQKIDALDSEENITYLGLHLADMPVDAQLGKCLLYGIIARCVDPVLTIISTLSVRDPFMLPIGTEEAQIQKTKNEFANGALSDHGLLLRTYEAWAEQKSRNREKQFSYKNYINNSNMEMIHGVRRLILRHLKDAGILSDRGPQNLRTLNKNSHNWTIIKACLSAGFYPNVCRINRANGKIYSRHEPKLMPHISSVLREGRKVKPEVSSSPTEWLIHGEKSRIANLKLIKNITLVASINICLFTGPLCLPPSSIQVIANANTPDEDDDDSDQEEDCHNDDQAKEAECKRASITLDDWISFVLNEDEANLLFSLRQKFNGVFIKFLKNPTSFNPTKEEELTLEAMQNVLTVEDSLRSDSTIETASISDEPSDQPIFMSPAYNNALNSRRRQKANNPHNNWRLPIPDNRDRERSNKFGKKSYARQMPNNPPSNWRQETPDNRERSNTNKRFGKKSYANTRGSEYSQRYTESSQEEATGSTSSAQHKLLEGLMNNPEGLDQCNYVAESDQNPIGPSTLVFHPNFTKYFALSIRSLGKLRETIFRKRWMFKMPIQSIQSVEEQFPNSAIILFFYVEEHNSICGIGQFETAHNSYRIINISKHNQMNLRPITNMRVPYDCEMDPQQGHHLLEYCRNAIY